MFGRLKDEIDAVMARDPAAHSSLEVALLYPGFQATTLHRPAHWLWRKGFRLAGRWISQFSRWWTGIEIHPDAIIGRRLVIDHGMGVVIGETAEVGDDVTLYHGCTLGGVAPSIDSESQRNVKRHPTLEDGVIVGSGAQILGPITVGRNARVGANAVVTAPVPENRTVVGIPARIVERRRRAPETPQEFMAYGTPTGEIPDPVARALEGLLGEVQTLRARVLALEEERQGSFSCDKESEEDRDETAKPHGKC